jgi:hypothetical protein
MTTRLQKKSTQSIDRRDRLSFVQDPTTATTNSNDTPAGNKLFILRRTHTRKMDQPPQQVQRSADEENATSGGSNPLLPPAFIEDPASFLTQIASRQPSRRGVSDLAGPVAKWFVSAAPKEFVDASASQGTAAAATPDFHPAVHLASHYLRAAAVQLRENSTFAGDLEQEMAKTRNQYEVLEAVGAAATLCPNRAGIASTGILPTLAQLMLHAQSIADAAPPAAAASASSKPSLSSNNSPILAASSANYPTLQQAGVEFLQCAVLAQHYRYAARVVQGTWPRPTNTVNIKTVLRYYYLRGLVHLGCGDYVMAHRCWWTCLALPAEGCSAIMVAAWKKMALVQPLLDRTRGVANVHYSLSNETTNAVTTRFPNSISKAMGQLVMARNDDAVLLYTQLGPAAEMSKLDLVETLIQTHEVLLRNDGNYGLAQQCLQRARDNQVWEASQLFSIVSVAQLAQRWEIAPEEVPQRLMDSKVPCQLEDDGMVVFTLSIPSDNGDSLPPPANHHDRSSWVDLSEWMQLLERLQHLEMNITTSSKYHASKEMEKGGGKSGGEAMGPRGVEDF